MDCTIHLSSPLWKFAENAATFQADGRTVKEVLGQLNSKAPKLGPLLFEPDGGLRNSVKIYLNNDDIDFLDRLETPVSEGDELFISPTLTGG